MLYFLMAEPSVCRLSVMLLHSTQRLELFGNIFASSNSSRYLTFCIRIFEKKFEGILGGRAT